MECCHFFHAFIRAEKCWSNLEHVALLIVVIKYTFFYPDIQEIERKVKEKNLQLVEILWHWKIHVHVTYFLDFFMYREKEMHCTWQTAGIRSEKSWGRGRFFPCVVDTQFFSLCYWLIIVLKFWSWPDSKCQRKVIWNAERTTARWKIAK